MKRILLVVLICMVLLLGAGTTMIRNEGFLFRTELQKTDFGGAVEIRYPRVPVLSLQAEYDKETETVSAFFVNHLERGIIGSSAACRVERWKDGEWQYYPTADTPSCPDEEFILGKSDSVLLQQYMKSYGNQPKVEKGTYRMVVTVTDDEGDTIPAKWLYRVADTFEVK